MTEQSSLGLFKPAGPFFPMTTDSEVPGSSDKHVFYHGTSLKAAESIARDGFRVWFQDDEIGRYAGGGNLGTGIYITCDWRVALWFGPALLRVTIRPGTRLLNAAVPPDGKIVAYLQREFGREVLKKPPWKVIPGNKKLTLRELIALFRYHYRNTWEKEYGKDRDGFPGWPMRRELHSRMLGGFKSLLIRYGFAGYGNPADDNGIVIFAEDRLILKEVVAEIPDPDYEVLHRDGFKQSRNIDELKKFFYRRGSKRARELSEQVAAAADKRLAYRQRQPRRRQL